MLPACVGASTIRLATPGEQDYALRNITVWQDKLSIVMLYPKLSQNTSVYVSFEPPSGPPGTEGWEVLPTYQSPCSNYYTKKLSNDSIQGKVRPRAPWDVPASEFSCEMLLQVRMLLTTFLPDRTSTLR